MAVSHKVVSIAFPTVGCGKLGYDISDVASCFLQAEKDTNALIKVRVLKNTVCLFFYIFVNPV